MVGILDVMDSQESLIETLPHVVTIARAAASAVMEIYTAGDVDVQLKSDSSPVTAADIAAHHIIADALRALTPTMPVVSEESADAIDLDADYSRYWLVDPIDGTKEFIRRQDEFTVNIGLIANGVPVLGVVIAPALDTAYYGVVGHGAFKRVGREAPSELSAESDAGSTIAVISKSHLNDATRQWLHRYGIVDTVSAGSSLKFCLVAEGAAAVYPRMGPQHFWDTAAADAVLRAAGGRVVVEETGELLRYDIDKTLLTPYYVAKGKGVA